MFFPYVTPYETFNDLDLYLLTLDDVVVASSTSFEHTEEHIFFDTGADLGSYKIVVHNSGGGLGTSQQYGLAWWFGYASGSPGDYDTDGDVDSADYGVWQQDFGTSVSAGTGADGSGNGMVDTADYVVWRKFTSSSGAGAFSKTPFVPPPKLARNESQLVPQPNGAMMLAVGCLAILSHARFHFTPRDWVAAKNRC